MIYYISSHSWISFMFILRSIQFQKYYFQTLTCFQSNYLNATFFCCWCNGNKSVMNEGHRWGHLMKFSYFFGQYVFLDMTNGQMCHISEWSSIRSLVRRNVHFKKCSIWFRRYFPFTFYLIPLFGQYHKLTFIKLICSQEEKISKSENKFLSPNDVLIDASIGH